MKLADIIYFFPGKTLTGDLSKKFPTKTYPATGPNGTTGGTLAARRGDVVLNWTDQTHTWREIDGVWIGVSKTGVQNEQFIRKERLVNASGYNVTLGDDQSWLIPVALIGSPNFSLPWRDMLDEKGNNIRETDPKYSEISNFADAIWQSLDDNGDLEMDDQTVRNICISAITVFYDLTSVEVYALGLLTQNAYQAILEAIIDRPGWRDLALKKKAEDNLNANGG